MSNKILRCIADGALISGLEPGRWEGFTHCPTCRARQHREFGSDGVIPAAKSPKAKSRIDHREYFARHLLGSAEFKLMREDRAYYGYDAREKPVTSADRDHALRMLGL